METEKILVETVDGLDIYFEEREEWASPQEHFPEKEDEELIKRIYNNDVAWFTAKVSACFDGIELSADYLGACCYDEASDFYKKYKSDYYSDMRKEVIESAKKVIKKMAALLPDELEIKNIKR